MLALALTALGPVHADGPLFGFIGTTDLLPKANWELEQWSTLKWPKAGGDFYQVDQRTEISATNDFQLSAYANDSFAPGSSPQRTFWPARTRLSSRNFESIPGRTAICD